MRRVVRYWTQSASPTQTGFDARSAPGSPVPGSGASSRCVPTLVQGDQSPSSRRVRSATPGSPGPRQRRPTRLKRFGARSGFEITPLFALSRVPSTAS